MDSARSTINGKTYTAYAFNQEPEGVKAAHRPAKFACNGCEGPAFFTGSTNEGFKPRFGARHIGDCDDASKKWTDGSAPGTTAVPAINNTGAVIHLTADGMAQTAPTAAPTKATATNPAASGPARHHTPTAGTRDTNKTTTGMGPLLRRLRKDASATITTQTMVVPGTTVKVPMAEAILTPGQITDQDNDKHRIIWGTFTSGGPTAAESKKPTPTAFLRCGTYAARTFYVRLAGDLGPTVLDQLNMDYQGNGNDAWDNFRDQHFITWGQIQRDKNGTPFINVLTLNQIYIQH